MPVPPEPPIGAVVQDRNGDRHTRTPMGWQDEGGKGKPSRTFVGAWPEFLRWYGPVNVIGSASDTAGKAGDR